MKIYYYKIISQTLHTYRSGSDRTRKGVNGCIIVVKFSSLTEVSAFAGAVLEKKLLAEARRAVPEASLLLCSSVLVSEPLEFVSLKSRCPSLHALMRGPFAEAECCSSRQSIGISRSFRRACSSSGLHLLKCSLWRRVMSLLALSN